MSTEDIPEVPEEREDPGPQGDRQSLSTSTRATVKKFAARQKNPLPVLHDHSGYWMDRNELAAWVAGERKSYADHVKREAEDSIRFDTSLAS